MLIMKHSEEELCSLTQTHTHTHRRSHKRLLFMSSVEEVWSSVPRVPVNCAGGPGYIKKSISITSIYTPAGDPKEANLKNVRE